MGTQNASPIKMAMDCSKSWLELGRPNVMTPPAKYVLANNDPINDDMKCMVPKGLDIGILHEVELGSAKGEVQKWDCMRLFSKAQTFAQRMPYVTSGTRGQ